MGTERHSSTGAREETPSLEPRCNAQGRFWVEYRWQKVRGPGARLVRPSWTSFRPGPSDGWVELKRSMVVRRWC